MRWCVARRTVETTPVAIVDGWAEHEVVVAGDHAPVVTPLVSIHIHQGHVGSRQTHSLAIVMLLRHLTGPELVVVRGAAALARR